MVLQFFSLLDDIIIISDSILGNEKACHLHLLAQVVCIISQFFSRPDWNSRNHFSHLSMQITLSMVRVITEFLKHYIYVIQIESVLNSMQIDLAASGKFQMMAKWRW